MATEHQLTRRSLIRAGGLAICACCVEVGPAAADTLRDVAGCSLIGRDFGLLDQDKLSQAEQLNGVADQFSNLTHSTGGREQDLAYDRALKRLSDAFGVVPSFAFYDDSDSPNAWASPAQKAPGTDGTVVFGRKLFDTLMSIDPSGVSVLQVSAHEFAHVTQYVSGTYAVLKSGQPTSKHIELHADFLSGYYLGLLKTGHPNASLWWAGQKIFDFGDYSYNNRTHHGTPQERVAAAEAGFRVSYFDKKDFSTASKMGVDYVVNT
jgi:hypothetical protein